MVLSQPIAGGVLAVLLVAGSAGALPVKSILEPSQRLTQGTPESETETEVEQNEALQRAAALSQQALKLMDAGYYTEAEPLYQQALTILQEQLGSNHPDVATPLIGLAGLYAIQRRYEEAESLYRQALTILQEQSGENHPDVAATLIGLAGLLYRVHGRYEEAESLYQQALAILREQPGYDNLHVMVLNNLATMYELQGRHKEAGSFRQQAQALVRKGDCALDAEAAQTERSYQSTLEHFRRNAPNGVPYQLITLASFYEGQGCYDIAEARYQEAVAIARKLFGKNHFGVAENLALLEAFYIALKQLT